MPTDLASHFGRLPIDEQAAQRAKREGTSEIRHTNALVGPSRPRPLRGSFRPISKQCDANLPPDRDVAVPKLAQKIFLPKCVDDRLGSDIASLSRTDDAQHVVL